MSRVGTNIAITSNNISLFYFHLN